MTTITTVDCRTSHELISARIDSELAPLDVERLDRHLAGCPGCRAFAGRAEQLARSMRVRPAEPTPDLAAGILLAAAPVPGASMRRFARLALAWLGVVQLAAALPALVWGDVDAAPVHLARHLGSFDVALAVGMLVAAARPRVARSLLPIAAVFAACVAATAVLDLVDGSTRAAMEVPHVIEVLAAGLLWVLCGAPRPTWRRRAPAPA